MITARSLRWVGQLIYKDFYVLRGSLLYITILSVLIAAMLSRIDQGWLFLGMWAGMSGYFFAISNCTFEDKVDGWTFMRTLPVSSGTIMMAKYVGNLLFTAACATVLTGLGYGVERLGWLAPAAVPVWYYTFLPMPFVLAFGGLTLWLSVRWDFRRAQMVIYASFLAIMLLPGLGRTLVPTKPLWAEQWATGSFHFHLAAGAWLFFAGLLALYAVFGLLAARAFARRDL